MLNKKNTHLIQIDNQARSASRRTGVGAQGSHFRKRATPIQLTRCFSKRQRYLQLQVARSGDCSIHCHIEVDDVHKHALSGGFRTNVIFELAPPLVPEF
jgi:hypothetical protein